MCVGLHLRDIRQEVYKIGKVSVPGPGEHNLTDDRYRTLRSSTSLGELRHRDDVHIL